MKVKSWIILVLIFILFIFSRLYKIGQIPPSLYWDEASIGYNAFSVAANGKDEWDELLPLHFRAFGEFKLPVYIYSVSIASKIFGSGALAVRFPAVLFSLGTLIFVYLIAKKLFKSKTVAYFSTFFLGITPWLFIISRVGYEATAGLMFFLAGLWLLLFSIKKPPYLILATIAFIFSIYSYNSFRILSPLILLAFFGYRLLINRKKVVSLLVPILLSITILTISFIPIYRLYRFDQGMVRAQVVALTGTKTEIVKSFITNYLKHFSYRFLFVQGDPNPRSQMPGWGQIYLISLPILVLGIVRTIRKRDFAHLMVVFILLVSPIPASITKESPHALRSILMALSLAILIGLGVKQMTESFQKYRVYLLAVVIGFYLIEFGLYFNSFLNLYPKNFSQDWQYGYKKLFEDYRGEFSKYQKVIISDRYAQPYIFALYYLNYDSTEFKNSVSYNAPDKWGFSTVAGFNTFKFKKVDEGDLSSGTLIFATNEDRLLDPANAEIKFLDGSTAFWVYKQ